MSHRFNQFVNTSPAALRAPVGFPLFFNKSGATSTTTIPDRHPRSPPNLFNPA